MKNHIKIMVCALAAVFLAGCTNQSNAASVLPQPSAPIVSQAPETPPQQDKGAQDESVRKTPAPEFELVDQNGNTHTLADYRGKVVFLNFWATWCPPCREEMPDIQQLYVDHGENSGDVVILGVALPKNELNNNTSEGTDAEVGAFMEENGYAYPTLMDYTGDVFAAYGITAYPTTFMIDTDGNLKGNVVGTIDRATMDSIVAQTMDS